METFLLNKDTIITCDDCKSGVLKAASFVTRDMQKVFGKSQVREKNNIIVRVNKENKMAPETFSIKVLDDKNLLVSSLDELGAIYGLFYISRKYLGINPSWFFCDQQIKEKTQAAISGEYHSKPFSIKYRGWFINDEVLLMDWDKKKPELHVWERAFETLLRSGGNMVIPGTGFHHDLRAQASSMGLWITHHHSEPLGAQLFLNVYPDEVPSYDINAPLFDKIWREAIAGQKQDKVVWVIGFRGQGDVPFWMNDPKYDTMEKRGELISQIMQHQYDLISEQVENPVVCTNLYGEILELYKLGLLKFPKGTIKIWADSGYGKMVSRRQFNYNPRVKAIPDKEDEGPHGIYYHASFYDLQASGHVTMLPNSPELVRDELTKAFKAGADEYLIVNCGNIRPHIYLLELISRLWTEGDYSTKAFEQEYMQSYFASSPEKAASCFDDYFKCTIQYGEHADEKAAEQFYHYLVRYIIGYWMRDKKTGTEEELWWATGDIPFNDQVRWFKKKCEGGLEGWQKLKKKCEETAACLTDDEKQRFNDWLYMQVIIHESGCRGGIAIGRSYELFEAGDYLKAFITAWQAKLAFEEGLTAMKAADHDKWQHFYDNDCLTNISLTVYFIDILAGYIRMQEDSPNFYNWERNYLYEKEDKGVALLTNTSKHLENEQLAEGLMHVMSEDRQ